MTHPGVHVLENHVEPGKTLGSVGPQRRGDSHTHGEHDDRRETGQVAGVHTDKEVVEKIRLLVGLKPLEREQVSSTLHMDWIKDKP